MSACSLTVDTETAATAVLGPPNPYMENGILDNRANTPTAPGVGKSPECTLSIEMDNGLQKRMRGDALEFFGEEAALSYFTYA